MTQTHVLVIEDDADINHIVTTHLTRGGYEVTQAFSGTEARMLLERAETGAASYHLVICDLMLPGIPGEELVRIIRAADARMPVIVISARAAATDRVDLLKLGADDYLTKPFDLDELTARIEVQLRHRGDVAPTSPLSPALRFRSWELDPEARTFSVDGAALGLTRLEFRIMETLMRRPTKVFTKQELFEQAWGEPYAADDGTVTVHVSNIRTKLRASGTDAYIKTVWGVGFKLVQE